MNRTLPALVIVGLLTAACGGGSANDAAESSADAARTPDGDNTDDSRTGTATTTDDTPTGTATDGTDTDTGTDDGTDTDTETGADNGAEDNGGTNDDGDSDTTTDGAPTAPAPGDAGNGTTIACWVAETDGSTGDLRFADDTDAFGLDEPLRGMHGHAAAFGDVDGDLLVDLVVGTFADRPVENYAVRGAGGPAPDRLLVGDGGGFAATDDLDGELGRTSGAVFADLDLDGDLDLVLTRNPRSNERQRLPSTVYENTGGELSPVDGAGIDPDLGGRSIGVLDADGDGRPDLFVLEDEWAGGSSRLYRNLGDLRFSDETRQFGLPLDVHGLGILTVDLNGDGLTDVFVGGSNRLFVGTGDGFAEVDVPELEWELPGAEDDVAGVDAADVNRDGRPDLVIGQHFNSTVDDDTTEPVRLYLNTTSSPGDDPSFDDVTDAAGLVGLPTKAPHVEFADLDNNSWPDIVTSASADDGTRPAVFRHLGVDDDGIPRFEVPDGLGSDQYWVTAPVADVDRDGRLDILLVEWEPTLGSVLLTNRSETGHWIGVSVDASLGGGPGTVVEVYEPGRGGDPEALVARREITVSAGYSAGREATAHLGVGDRRSVDVVVHAPGGTTIELDDVAVDRHLRLPEGCHGG